MNEAEGRLAADDACTGMQMAERDRGKKRARHPEHHCVRVDEKTAEDHALAA